MITTFGDKVLDGVNCLILVSYYLILLIYAHIKSNNRLNLTVFYFWFLIWNSNISILNIRKYQLNYNYNALGVKPKLIY